MFQLDTNVASELRHRKPNQSATVRNWASGFRIEHFFLSAVTIMELEMGVLAMERKDALQGRILRVWLAELRQTFSSRILPSTETTATLCAALHVPNRRLERDAMIAATAKQQGYTLVTRNTEDVRDCGVQLLNPWVSRDVI